MELAGERDQLSGLPADLRTRWLRGWPVMFVASRGEKHNIGDHLAPPAESRSFSRTKNAVDFRGDLVKFNALFMKNDTTTTALNFVLATLVILGVLFALLNIWRTRDLRQLQTSLQAKMQQAQVTSVRAQSLLNDVIAFNATNRNPELAQIIKSAEAPQPATPAAK